jgi:molecular chaperone HscB
MIEIRCVQCGAETDKSHFCLECGRIQPVPDGTGYFEFLGLPLKFSLDPAELEKTFYSLSRQFHPDYFTNAAEGERQASIERSSMLNDAYRTLSDPVSRAQYLLGLHGYKEAEKKAPPELLEEVFELNMEIEQLRAAKRAGDRDEIETAHSSLESALQQFQGKLNLIDREIAAFFTEWDSSRNGMLLDRVSEKLSHRSYIRNLVRDIQEEI